MPFDVTTTSLPAFDCPARDGTVADAVQGVVPRVVLMPESEEQAASVLAQCNAAGLAVVPRGGGTLQEVGYAPERCDALLSLEHLNQVIRYEPGDLTISVQAGIALGPLQLQLARNGQLLPFTVADPHRATIGGAVATNLSGPRRFGAGGYRELLIGVTVAGIDGTVSRGGGLVVKNVSGYDMMKLHLGALGTLGVLLRVNFKALTLAAGDATAVLAGEQQALLTLARAIAGSQLAADSLELFGPGTPAVADTGWRLAVRLTGSSAGIVRKRTEVESAAASAAIDLTWCADANALWESYATFLAPGHTPVHTALVRIAGQATDVGPICQDLAQGAATAGLTARISAHAGSGIVYGQLTGANLEPALTTVWPDICARWSNATILAAPAALKSRLEVWGAPPPGLALMRQIKARFDPKRTLNPGRFVGRL